MTLNQFLQNNSPLCSIAVALLVAIIIVEFLSHSGGVLKLSTHEAVRFMNKKRSHIFDLRDPTAFAAGHIKNSKQIKSGDLVKNASAWIKKTELPVLLVAEHEHAAVSAALGLKKSGYTDVAILAGGMAAWRKENLPLNHSKSE